jgi:PEP-CTERM motif
MHKRSFHTSLAAAALGLLLTSGAASAALTYNADVEPTKANNDFIPGGGIPSNGFAIDTVTSGPFTGASVALKARARVGGQPLSVVNDVYTVSPGLAPSSTSPWWSFDFQLSPGPNGTIADGLKLFLTVDFDPAYGQVDPVTLGGTVPVPGVFSTIANPGGGAWSDNSIDYVVADSWNLGFTFWNTIFGKTYNPNTLGEYEIGLRATDSSNNPLAEVEILVQVVPEPSTAALLGVGALALLRRRRGVVARPMH